MCCDTDIQFLVKNYLTAAVRPAANIYSDANGRWMPGSVFNVYAEDGAAAAHALRAQPNSVNGICQKCFQFCSAFIGVVCSQ